MVLPRQNKRASHILISATPLFRGVARRDATRPHGGTRQICSVEIAVFRKMNEEEVVALALGLYQLLGGVALEGVGRSEIWRRDENAGTSAVYQITHGYHIAQNGQGLAIIVTENWAESHGKGQLVASAYTVKACDAVDLTVQHKNGQLKCRFSGDSATESICSEYINGRV
jgi:hypothetical protein